VKTDDKKRFIVRADAKVSATSTVRGDNVEEVEARMKLMNAEDMVTLILLERKEKWEIAEFHVVEAIEE